MKKKLIKFLVMDEEKEEDAEYIASKLFGAIYSTSIQGTTTRMRVSQLGRALMHIRDDIHPLETVKI